MELGIKSINTIPFAVARLASDILGHSGADTPSIHWGQAVCSHQGTISCLTPASWARSVNLWWVVMTCRRFLDRQSSGFIDVRAQFNLVGVKSQMKLRLQFVGRGACKCFKNAMIISGGLQAIPFTLLCWMRLIHFAVKSAQGTRHVTFFGHGYPTVKTANSRRPAE